MTKEIDELMEHENTRTLIQMLMDHGISEVCAKDIILRYTNGSFAQPAGLKRGLVSKLTKEEQYD